MLCPILTLLAAAGVAASLHDNIRARVQAALDVEAQTYNTSFSFGFANVDGTAAVVAGIADHENAIPAKLTDRYPSGSVTKTYTAAAVAQVIETGAWTMQTTVASVVDPLLQRVNGTTLDRLWAPGKGGGLIKNVTLGQLLHMSSGLQDYNDTWLQKWTVDNPHKDFTPIDFLYEVDKDFLCYPGTCSAYTSVGYMLLGLALSEHSAPGTATQFSFDQHSVIPQGVKDLSNYSFENTGFPLKGPCTNDKNIVPKQYKTIYPPKGQNFVLSAFDISKTSCLNGWTCGNLAHVLHLLITYTYFPA